MRARPLGSSETPQRRRDSAGRAKRLHRGPVRAPPCAADPSMPDNTILVATDFSTTSRAAVDWAAALAKELGAKLIVAHWFDLPVIGFPDAALQVNARTATRMSDEAQAALDSEIARIARKGIVVDGLLRQGDARSGASELAASCGARLIVVGSHGRTGIARALLGSVAESILRTSSLPVAVVRKDGASGATVKELRRHPPP